MMQKILSIASVYRYSVMRKLSTLQSTDKEVFSIMSKEQVRQKEGINLIPSENHCSKGVLEALGSVMYCKYAEGNEQKKTTILIGYPGARYYGGT